MTPDASREEMKERVKQLTRRVSELEKVEQAFQEAETIAKLLGYAPHAVFLLDLFGRVVFANKSGAAHLGRSVEEILGSTLLDHFPADVSENRRLKSLEAIRSKRSVSFEDRVGEHWYHNTVFPIMDGSGKINHLAIYGFDITDRKATEQSLGAKTEELDKYFMRSMDLLCIADTDGFFRRLNPEWEKTLGYTLSELEGNRFLDYVHPDDVGSTVKAVSELAEGKEVLNFVNRYRCKDGAYRCIEWRSFPVGKLIYAVARDITERKRVEEALRISEEKMRSIFSAAPVGIGVVVNRVFTEVNQRFCDMTGYPRGELINRSARMIYPTDQDFEIVGREKYLQIAKSGAGTVETRCKRKDGSVIDVLMSSTPIDPADLSRGVTFTALDITERKRAEEERERLQAQLLQAQKMEAVGRLAGGMAHDLNNLLSPILGYGEILQLDIAQNDARRKAVDEIVQAAFRAKEIIRQILAFSRKQTMVIKIADLNEVVKNFAKLLRRTIREDVEIRTVLFPDLPPARVDVGQIEQVIMNLAVNAQDAMPDGGTLTIRTALVRVDEEVCAHHVDSKPGTYVMMSVSDTGCGMDRETTQHIFEPFFTTKGQHGTGLGLATAYGIVKQHDGYISVESEMGKGTTFKIYLPATAEPIAETVKGENQTTDLRGVETVLVVEDNDQIRLLVREILQRLGYKVLLAENGSEALAILDRNDKPVDLLLTDVVMPDINGRELFERASEHFLSLKVLYMSGYSSDVLSHRGVVEEGVEIIQKPFSFHDLVRKVREVLDRP